MEQFIVTGMSCAACQSRVEKAVSQVPGVTSCAVSLLTNSMGVEGSASSDAIIQAVEKAGYGASLKGMEKTETASANEDMLADHETPKLKRRLILSVGFLAALMYITMGFNMWGWPLPAYFTHNHLGLALTQMLLALAVMVINRKFFTSGFSSLLHGAPNMDTLVALGSSVSFAWSLFVFYQMCGMITTGADNMELMNLYHNQLYFESAAMIPALITVGKMLEAMSKGRTTDALKSLMKLAPKTAVVLEDGEEKTIPAEAVQSGMIFVVKPGESIPVDGIVLEGSSAVDESALTGESIPVDKAVNDTVSAATINRSGYLKCQATRVGEDTTLSQIIQMVTEAAATKAPIARIADRVSGIFVPAVMAIATLTAIGWLIAGKDAAFALARGISVLVISCPCALGLATPVAIMVGNGMGAKNGILFKTSESLEAAGKIEIIALDKTGTITAGTPQVTDIVPADGYDEQSLLKLAAAIEAKSEHPLARAIMAKAEDLSSIEEVSDFKALPGNGLQGTLHHERVYAGSMNYVRTIANVSNTLIERADAVAEEGKTPLFFAKENTVCGMIAVADVIKEDSPEAIRQLRKMGIRVVMLTGDNERTANAIGRQAEVDQVIAGVLPEGKEETIRRLQEFGRTAMVGDGINDAPALTRADIGIAIGVGTDVAIDSADIVLMNSKLTDVSAVIRLSRATLHNIHENLFWAFFYNLICIPLAAGLLKYEMNPMIGAAAMSLSSFTVCMNALRLNLFHMHDASHDKAIKPVQIGEIQNKETETVRIDGMMCEHCEKRIEKAISSLPGVVSVKANHQSGTAIVESTRQLNDEELKKVIEEQDYTFIGKGEEKKMTVIVNVEGMMCEHCEATVKKALEKIDGVVEAKADHTANKVELTTSKDVDEKLIKEAIEDKDYTYVGIVR